MRTVAIVMSSILCIGCLAGCNSTQAQRNVTVSTSEFIPGAEEIFSLVPLSSGVTVFTVLMTGPQWDVWAIDSNSDQPRLLMESALLLAGVDREPHTWNGRTLIIAEDSNFEQSIWLSDGTTEGTSFVADPYVGPGFLSIRDSAIEGNRLVLSGYVLLDSVFQGWTVVTVTLV